MNHSSWKPCIINVVILRLPSGVGARAIYGRLDSAPASSASLIVELPWSPQATWRGLPAAVPGARPRRSSRVCSLAPGRAGWDS